MPHLGRYRPILNCVFFLYQTKLNAEKGSKSGGTGFLVAVPSLKWPGRYHIHGVTNWHVAVKNTEDHKAAPCIRINTKSGKPKIFAFSANEWFFKKDSYDIAISPPLRVDLSLDEASPLDFKSFFLSSEDEIKDAIGPAEDVFMVGRFINYDGMENNSPAFRFGHISIMDAQVKQSTDYVGRMIVLDMNSRTGFSGSPVFIYRTIGSYFFDFEPDKVLVGGGHYLKLLGIHEGQFPELWELKNKNPDRINSKNSLTWEDESSESINTSLFSDGNYISGYSGMTRIIPASCITEVLNLSELDSMRTESNSQSSG